MPSPLVCTTFAHTVLIISRLRGMLMYCCGQQRGSVRRGVSRDSGVLRVNRRARLRGMKEGCKEALRETLAVSPALSITAYLSNCLYIQPHKQKNDKMAASFVYRPGVGRGRETEKK